MRERGRVARVASLAVGAALRLVEELRIGESTGDREGNGEGADEYQLADVRFVVPAPDGGVYVWDHILASLRQYDGEGRFVRRIGRHGSGPGEYRSANGIVVLRDGRLVLWDPENRRLNVYDRTGSAVEIVIATMRQVDRSWRWNGPSMPDVKAFFSEIRPAADGRVWVQRGVRGVPVTPDEAPPAGVIPPIGGGGGPPIPPRRWREPVVFDVFAADGRFLGTLAVPERAQLLHMRGDHVWGVVRDEVDVPSVVRWRIAPSLASRESSP